MYVKSNLKTMRQDQCLQLEKCTQKKNLEQHFCGLYDTYTSDMSDISKQVMMVQSTYKLWQDLSQLQNTEKSKTQKGLRKYRRELQMRNRSYKQKKNYK